MRGWQRVDRLVSSGSHTPTRKQNVQKYSFFCSLFEKSAFFGMVIVSVPTPARAAGPIRPSSTPVSCFLRCVGHTVPLGERGGKHPQRYTVHTVLSFAFFISFTLLFDVYNTFCIYSRSAVIFHDLIFDSQIFKFEGIQYILFSLYFFVRINVGKCVKTEFWVDTKIAT